MLQGFSKLQWISKLLEIVGRRAGAKRGGGSRFRPCFEALENRALMSANVVMEGLSRLQSTKVQYQYEVRNEALPAPFTVNFYRSSNATLGTGDVFIGSDL